jgi:hypothetical protein
MMVSLSAGESGGTGCGDAVPPVCTTVLRLPESASETEAAAEEDKESTRGGSSEPACASVLGVLSALSSVTGTSAGLDRGRFRDSRTTPRLR